MKTTTKKRFTPENFGVLDAFVIDEILHDLIASLAGLYSVCSLYFEEDQPQKAKELNDRGTAIHHGEFGEFKKSYEEREEAIERYSKEFKELSAYHDQISATKKLPD